MIFVYELNVIITADVSVIYLFKLWVLSTLKYAVDLG
jgi:hypothetical protein